MQRIQIEHPFEPIIDEQSKILILGSFPSPVSRQQNFYYANKNNRFWKVMEILFDEEITDRTTFCHNHHIALWDVIHSCTIKGASDASISDVVPNDIHTLIEQYPITTIFTTGKTATKLYNKYITCNIEHIGLPSTSSANAKMKLNDLVNAYHVIQEKLI